MKKMLLCLLSMPLISSAGSLDPSSGPAPTMATLDQIYNRLSAMPVMTTNESGATSADVLSGKEFWGLSSAEWGPRTGTIPDQGAGPSITPTSVVQTLSAGYYSSDISVDGDADLIAENIAEGINLFGVTGTLSGGSGLIVPQTGQTSVYRAGDNGTYATNSAPAGQSRFVVDGDTVTDSLTGLMWAKNLHTSGEKNWDAAIDYCNNLTLGGHSDWRLPSSYELLSVLQGGLAADAFTVDSTYERYWSSTTLLSGAGCYVTWEGILTRLGKVSSVDMYAWPVRNAN